MTTRTAALPKDLRQQNYQEIMRLMCVEKCFTIAHISQAMNISRQTVTKAIEYFMSLGIVAEGGMGDSTNVGGRKPKEYRLNDRKYVLVVAIYDKKLHFDLRNLMGVRVADRSVRRNTMGLDEYIHNFRATLAEMMETYSIRFEDIVGIEATSGGVIDEQNGIVYGSRDWDEVVNVRDEISKILPGEVYIGVGNVASVSARSLMTDIEMLGKRAVVVYLDNGIGITLIEDGRVKSTKHNLIGESGHMILDIHSEKKCHINDTGCFESLIYESQIIKMAEELPEERKEAIFAGYEPEKDFRNHVLKMSEAGNADAKEIAEYMATVCAAAFQNLEFSFDPDLFYIAGTFQEWTDSFKASIEKRMKKNIFLKRVNIVIESAKDSVEQMMAEGSIGIILQHLISEE